MQNGNSSYVKFQRNISSLAMEDAKETAKLFLAIANGKVRQIDRLLGQLDDINIRDADSKTPLMYAVCCTNDEVRTHVVRILLRHGADVNAQDMNGQTALMFACMECERSDIVRLISRNKKCDFNIQDNDGFTAVMHSINSSNLLALRMLVDLSTKQDVDLKIRNAHSLNALELAVKLQMPEFCKCLLKEGNVKIGSVRDQKGLHILLDRDTKLSNANMKMTVDVPSLQIRRPSTPISNSFRRESTFDRDMNRLLDDDESGRGSVGPKIREPLTPNTRRQQTDWAESPRALRRPLKPIAGRDIQVTANNYIPSLQPDSPVFGHRTKLPSIPSGKRLYLVSTPRGTIEKVQEIV
ncbi:putative ankyrin repeat protein RF_0381 [Saccostrea cucullata]|uniref:putative ankyrin repeat protein RF_0381 n=1 Tax=Saccostrea cuccullata TaxID=36930 RepID=UPI002ED0B128